jgi:uncharacterized protein YkwD
LIVRAGLMMSMRRCLGLLAALALALAATPAFAVYTGVAITGGNAQEISTMTITLPGHDAVPVQRSETEDERQLGPFFIDTPDAPKAGDAAVVTIDDAEGHARMVTVRMGPNGFAIDLGALLPTSNTATNQPPPHAVDLVMPRQRPQAPLAMSGGLAADVFKEANELRAEGVGYAKDPAEADAIRAVSATHPFPMPLLTWAPPLATAAAGHVAQVGPLGLISHNGPNGDTPMDRIQGANYFATITDEDISMGQYSAAAVIRQLILERLHLLALINGKLVFVGIACGPNKVYGVMCVIDLANAAVNGAGTTTVASAAPPRSTGGGDSSVGALPPTPGSPQALHSATRAPSGVQVVGSGGSTSGSTAGVASPAAAYAHTPTRLSTGQLVIIGGYDSTAAALASIERITPTISTSSASALPADQSLSPSFAPPAGATAVEPPAILTLQAEGATQSSVIVLPHGLGTDLRIFQQASVAPGPALHEARIAPGISITADGKIRDCRAGQRYPTASLDASPGPGQPIQQFDFSGLTATACPGTSGARQGAFAFTYTGVATQPAVTIPAVAILHLPSVVPAVGTFQVAASDPLVIGTMSDAHMGAGSALMDDGTVVIVGGMGASGCENGLKVPTADIILPGKAPLTVDNATLTCPAPHMERRPDGSYVTRTGQGTLLHPGVYVLEVPRTSKADATASAVGGLAAPAAAAAPPPGASAYECSGTFYNGNGRKETVPRFPSSTATTEADLAAWKASVSAFYLGAYDSSGTPLPNGAAKRCTNETVRQQSTGGHP